MKRKKYTPEYKAKIVLEALREELTVSELASRKIKDKLVQADKIIIGRKLTQRYMEEIDRLLTLNLDQILWAAQRLWTPAARKQALT